MTARNDITGDELKSKINSDAYRNNYDAIFGKKTRKNISLAGQIEEREREIRESQQRFIKENESND